MTDPKLDPSNVRRFDFVGHTDERPAAMMPGTAYVWAKDYDTLERRLQEAQRDIRSAVDQSIAEHERALTAETERDAALRELAAERENKK